MRTPSRRKDSLIGYNGYAEVSDPKMVARLGEVQPILPEDVAVVRELVRRSFPSESPEDRTARAELGAILFDDPLETELLAA